MLAALVGVGVALTRAAGAGPRRGVPPAALLVAVAPTLAALGVLAVSDRLPGAWGLLRTAGTWRAGWRWYALALLAPVVLVLLTNRVHTALGGSPPPRWLAVPQAPRSAQRWRRSPGGAVRSPPPGALRRAVGERPRRCGVATWHEWQLLTPGGREVGHNAAIDLLPVPPDAAGGWQLVLAALHLALAVVVVRATDPRTLTRAAGR